MDMYNDMAGDSKLERWEKRGIEYIFLATNGNGESIQYRHHVQYCGGKESLRVECKRLRLTEVKIIAERALPINRNYLGTKPMYRDERTLTQLLEDRFELIGTNRSA